MWVGRMDGKVAGLQGRDAVRDYWQRQWREIDPQETTAFHAHGPDTVRVSAQHVVRDPEQRNADGRDSS